MLQRRAVLRPTISRARWPARSAALAFPLFVAEFLRRAAGKDGPAAAFLRWPRAALAIVRRQIVLVETVALPAFAIAALLDIQPRGRLERDSRPRGLLLRGRVPRGSACIACCRRGGTIVAAGASPHRPPVDAAAAVAAAWLPACVAVLIIVIALVGYYYTAFVLVERLWLSALVVLVFVVANAATLRWLAGASRIAAPLTTPGRGRRDGRGRR